MRLKFTILFIAGMMCQSQASEVLSPIVSSEDAAAYNGWTEFARTAPISTDAGRVTAIGMYSTVPCQWRPKIGKRLDPHETGQPNYLVAYSHHQLVSHPGNGWQWVELTVPLQPFDGAFYAGAYITGCSTGTVPMALHRAETQGDAIGYVTLSENQFETFAMGIRYVGQTAYRYDFDRGDKDGWSAYATTVAVTAGEFKATSPFIEDANHDATVGRFNLLAYRYFEYGVAGGGWNAPDFNGARVRMRIRFDNWSAPAGTSYYLHFQGRIPGSEPSQFSNWTYTGLPLNQYVDGQWHELDVTLSNDPSDYTFAGGPSPLYAYAPLDVTLSNLQDMIIVAARPPASAIPTGTFRLDWIEADFTR